MPPYRATETGLHDGRIQIEKTVYTLKKVYKWF